MNSVTRMSSRLDKIYNKSKPNNIMSTSNKFAAKSKNEEMPRLQQLEG